MKNFRISRLDYEGTNDEELVDVTEHFIGSPVLVNLGGTIFFPVTDQGDGQLELRKFDLLRFELLINNEWILFKDFIHS